uniref:Methyltransferase type 11 domain-containing protein n=1 Tax=viral metagenome TaxID=1070528 RepID=A0A6C0BFZ8_9ZZZZ
MNTYKICKYSHKINVSVKKNDFNKIDIYNDKIQRYSSLIGGSDKIPFMKISEGEPVKQELLPVKQEIVSRKYVPPRKTPLDYDYASAASAPIVKKDVLSLDIEIDKYIRCIKKTETFSEKQEFEEFKKHFMKLHSTNDEIKINFQTYMEPLTLVYTYILDNIDKIEIKVDQDKVNSANKAKREICNFIFKNEDYVVEKDRLSIVDFGGAQGIFLSNLCTELNTNRCTVIESKDSGFIYDDKLKKDNVNIIFWDNLKFDGIADNSVDCCCAIQVLHHLRDEIIRNVLNEFYRILKPNGVVYLIEHDYKKEILANIDSDHHLYYIMNDQIRLIKDKKLNGIKECVKNFKEYIKSYTSNYKQKEDWKNIMKHHKFTYIKEQSSIIKYNGRYFSIYKKI